VAFECPAQGACADVFAFPRTAPDSWGVALETLFAGLFGWLARRLAGVAVAALTAAAIYGAWLFVRQEALQEWERRGRLDSAIADREKIGRAREALAVRTIELRAEAAAQETRLREATRTVAEIRDREGWWGRWFGDRRERAENADRVARAEAAREEAAGRLAALRRALEQAGWELEGLDAAWRRVNDEISFLERGRSWFVRWIGAAWEAAKWYVIGGLAVVLLGPVGWAAVLYHGLAPLASRGGSLRLGDPNAANVDAGASRSGLEVPLQPGGRLLVRGRFLQASDEDLARGTRLVLDWRIPFTCAACGLAELVELRHRGADGERRVTLAGGGDDQAELSLVTLPAGASLILRPRFLAAVAEAAGQRLRIRRHRRWLSWRAWVTGTVRHFEFMGPCRLVVTGGRGVRVERLEGGAGGPAPARRLNRGVTIGFTPGLESRPARAETFWGYYRGRSRLFDDVFSGRGAILVQAAPLASGPAARRRAVPALREALLRLLGL
jgi:hypothetical protein